MEYPFKRRKISEDRREPMPERRERRSSPRSRIERRAMPASSPRIMDLRDPLLLREAKRERRKLDPTHEQLHHRQVDVVLTADVVVATAIVSVDLDALGNTLAVQQPALPSVPAVPAFPSDLTVPAVPTIEPVTLPQVPLYPFVTFAPGQGAGASAALSINNTAPSETLVATAAAVLPSASETLTATPNAISEAASSTTASSAPSTLPPPLAATAATTASSVATSAIITSSAFAASTSPVTSAVSGISSVSSIVASVRSAGSFTGTESDASFVQSIATSIASDFSQPSDGTVPGLIPAGTTSNVPYFTGGAGDDASASNDDEPTTPQIAGGVVGGVAGFAIMLGLILFLLRYLKQRHRGGALMLEEPEPGRSQPPMSTSNPGGGLIPPAAAAFFGRMSGASRDSDNLASPSQERSFQRISGRKLPSAFSPGMSSEDAARHMQNLSQTSFYRDSDGFYGGADALTAGAAAGAAGAAAKEKETLMSSPARTPVVHHPPEDPFSDDHALGKLEPPISPRRLDPRSSKGTIGTLGRSHPSFDGSRGSKFTEDLV